jgi:hypothetical protein
MWLISQANRARRGLLLLESEGGAREYVTGDGKCYLPR